MKFILWTGLWAVIAGFLIMFFVVLKGDKKTVDSIGNEIDRICSGWKKPGSPGCAVLVYRNGKTVFEKGYGLANLEYNEPITANTLFHIASVSKQFTAFAILLLENAGRLSLDDDVRKYLPYVPDFGTKITIRNLINHTSGLRDQWDLSVISGMSEEDVITQDQILRFVAHQKDLNFKPGDEYMYSNTGYTLLAEIVRKVSGESFCDYTKKHIFSPLGMKDTFFHIDQDQVIDDRAYSYNRNENGTFKNSILSYANVGATSLYTNVSDMSKWIDSFFTFKAGNKVVYDRLLTVRPLNSGKKISYACGVVVDEYKGYHRISHSGGDAGFRSYLAVFPDMKLGIVVLCNLGDMNPEEIAMKIAGIYLPDKTGEIGQRNEPNEIKLSMDVLNRYAGKYESDATGVVDIEVKDGGLALGLGPYKFRLRALSENRFYAAETSSVISFKTDGSGKAAKFIVNEGKESSFEAGKIKPMELAEDDLKKYTGEYYCPELEIIYTVSARDGKLSAKSIRMGETSLSGGKKDVFYIATDAFSGKIIFERNKDGCVTGFKLSTSRVRNLQFVKK